MKPILPRDRRPIPALLRGPASPLFWPCLVGLTGLILPAAAQHPAIELPLSAGDRSREVAAVWRATESGLEVSYQAGTERRVLPWDELDLTPTAVAPHDLLILNEARKTARRLGEIPFPLGLAVDAALQRGAWAATAPAADPAGASAHPTTAPEIPADPSAPDSDPGFELWRDCRLIDNPHNSGDSFQIRTHRGEDFILRLYWVDCPEIDQERAELLNRQNRTLGLSKLENEAVGRYARAVTTHLLGAEPFTVLTRRAPGMKNWGAAVSTETWETLPREEDSLAPTGSESGSSLEQTDLIDSAANEDSADAVSAVGADAAETEPDAAATPDPHRARLAEVGKPLPVILGFVVLAGRASTAGCEASLGDELVARGLAMVSDPQADPPGPQNLLSIQQRLEQLQDQAEKAHLGAWALSRHTEKRR